MGKKEWTNPDKTRQLKYTYAREFGDSSYWLILKDLKSNQELFSAESDKMAVLPGVSGQNFYILEWKHLEVRSVWNGALKIKIDGSYSSFVPDDTDLLLLCHSDLNGQNNHLSLYSIQTGKLKLCFEGIRGAFNRDASLIVTMDMKGTIRVFDTKTGRLNWSATVTPDNPEYVFFDSSGKHVIAEYFSSRLINNVRESIIDHRFYCASTGTPLPHPSPIPIPTRAYRRITMWGHEWPEDNI